MNSPKGYFLLLSYFYTTKALMIWMNVCLPFAATANSFSSSSKSSLPSLASCSATSVSEAAAEWCRLKSATTTTTTKQMSTTTDDDRRRCDAKWSRSIASLCQLNDVCRSQRRTDETEAFIDEMSIRRGEQPLPGGVTPRCVAVAVSVRSCLDGTVMSLHATLTLNNDV